MSPAEYLAIGFPFITGAVLAAFFPIRLRDYFVEGEIQQLGHGLTPYKFKARHYLGIFVIYLLSASFLTIIQAYLLWDLAPDARLRFSSRFTDFFLYPVFPSALMAVLLMLFVFSYKYVRKGEDDVRKFLLRTYDGWPLYKEIPRFKPVALAAGILCTAANYRIYNVYVNVTDKGIEYSDVLMMKPVTIPYEDIWTYQVIEYQDGKDGKDDSFRLRIMTKDFINTELKYSLVYTRNALEDIDKIIRAAQEEGGYTDTVFTREGEDNSKLYWGTLLDVKKDSQGAMR